MSRLFEPITLRELTLRNRVFVSPMCQYSSTDGLANDWHLVHLGSRAIGGAGLVIAEATAVAPEGRITPGDTGLWSDRQIAPFRRITDFIRAQGAAPGLQLAHAGRKASTKAPWEGGGPLRAEHGAWPTVAPSAVPFAPGWHVPKAATDANIEAIADAFKAAAARALEAGFDVVEIHMAHGYLLHEFLSPLSNHRTDEYGGSLENRMRLPLRIAREIRAIWPDRLPVLVRISTTDWVQGGWDLEQSVEFCRSLKQAGIDLIDCSSGGNAADAKIPTAPGYQVPNAAEIRRRAGIATGAVGLITDPAQAEQILAQGGADAVLIAREFLRDPYWPLRAARKLGAKIEWPKQYERAKPQD